MCECSETAQQRERLLKLMMLAEHPEASIACHNLIALQRRLERAAGR